MNAPILKKLSLYSKISKNVDPKKRVLISQSGGGCKCCITRKTAHSLNEIYSSKGDSIFTTRRTK